MSSGGSGGGTELPHNLAEAAGVIDLELRRKSKRVMKLEPTATRALADAHADYFADVGREAIRIARKDGLQCVEGVHVAAAVKQYGSAEQSKLGNGFNTIGGLLAGAGLAGGYAVLFTPGDHSPAEMGTTLALCIVGFVLLSIGLTMTMINRR